MHTANPKFLLRTINTFFATTSVSSIDHHNLTIVSTDFVPISPYTKSSVLVSIGQRYNVIVEVNLLDYDHGSSLPTDGNHWIRTYIAPCRSARNECDGPKTASCGYEKTGILRYNKDSKQEPTTLPWEGIHIACADEDPAKLTPFLLWTVGKPINGPKGEESTLSLNSSNPRDYPLASWALNGEPEAFKPTRVNYLDPTFLHLDNTGDWDQSSRIMPADYKEKDWVRQPSSIPPFVNMNPLGSNCFTHRYTW